MKNLLIQSLLMTALMSAVTQAQPALGVLPKSEQTQYAQPTAEPVRPGCAAGSWADAEYDQRPPRRSRR